MLSYFVIPFTSESQKESRTTHYFGRDKLTIMRAPEHRRFQMPTPNMTLARGSDNARSDRGGGSRRNFLPTSTLARCNTRVAADVLSCVGTATNRHQRLSHGDTAVVRWGHSTSGTHIARRSYRDTHSYGDTHIAAAEERVSPRLRRLEPVCPRSCFRQERSGDTRALPSRVTGTHIAAGEKRVSPSASAPLEVCGVGAVSLFL